MKRVFCTAVCCGLLLSLGAADRLIIEDFSDVGTWRAWSRQNVTPGKWFGADLVLGATPDASRDDGYAGKLRFDFADPDGTGCIEYQRAKASQPEVFADGVEFDADARGIPGRIRFILEDTNGKRFATEPVELTGRGWKRYRSETGSRAGEFTPPFKLHRLRFEASGVSGGNYILIDDIALTGGVSRKRKVSIRPVLAPLATEPGKPGRTAYRLRSASELPIEGKFICRLSDRHGKCVMEKTLPVKLAPFGSTVAEIHLPPLAEGSYQAFCEFVSGRIRTDYPDWIGVFRPNNGRNNSTPMWFGIQDTVIWNCEAENELHNQWKKLAGFDIERFGITGSRIDEGNVNNFPAVRKFLDFYRQLGMLCCFSYTEGVPAVTQNRPKHRGAPTNSAEFRKHMDRVFGCIGTFEPVRYFEFWNEPDLDFYNGTLDEYLTALKVVHDSRNAVAPGIRITTGGVTIRHPREKKNFSRDVYAKGKGLYDIACFHAHGSLMNYSERQEMVEKWLDEAGVDLPVCNTETGDRAGYAADTIRRQAETLVRKIVYAKSRNTEFYIWFTLQDYWDMDPEADDSFGLVTSDNRPKPSFVAYNELIRQLGSTGRGELLKNTGELDIYRFLSSDGRREVLALWPRIGGTRHILPLEGSGELAAVDLYGRPVPARVQYNYAAIPVEDAMYVSFPAGAFRYGSAVAVQKQVVGGSAGTDARVELTVRNPFAKAALVEFDGGRLPLQVAETATLPVRFPIPAAAGNGIFTTEKKLRVVSGTETLELTVPVTVNVSYPVASGGKPAQELVLDTLDRVNEMSFDPNIRRWMGPKDLSCRFAMTRADGSLNLDIRVTDDKHVMNSTPAEAWKDDSIQVGFATLDGKFTEVTLSGKDGRGAVYAHHAFDPALCCEWKVPAEVARSGDVTRYKVSLPLDRLGIPDKAGTLFRFSFLVNENDGKGRIRWIEWMGGIGRAKNPDEFGWGILK